MKTLLEKLLKFLGLLVLIIVVSLIPELLGGDIAALLKEKLGERYYLTIGGIGFFTILAYALWSEGDKIFKKDKDVPAAETVSADNLQQIRAGLLESYQQRQASKLADRFPVNLELKYSTEGSPTKADIYDNKTIRSTRIKEELIDLFDRHRGRLLIIGAPGAGKTTLLLQLAHELLHRQGGTIVEVPVIINMATWRERFTSVEDWLMELLPQMGFSKGLATQFLQDKLLLPLFDGLDELAAELRAPCLEAISDYGGRQQHARYVICSRIVEYAETVDAPVHCQILVKPLNLTQIKNSLQEINSREANGILDAIRKDPLLAEVIKTPFYLNTVQLLFAPHKQWEEFHFSGATLEAREHEIVEAFVQNAARGFSGYSVDQVKHYLGFLADRMNWKGLVEFELVSLQYDWVRLTRREEFVGKFLDGLVYGLVYGLVGGLFYGLVYGLVGGLVYGLVFSLIYGLVFSLVLGLILGLFVGLGIGLVFGLVVGQGNNRLTGPIAIITRDSIKWSFASYLRAWKKNLVYGLVGGLVFGLVVGLVFSRVLGLVFGLVVGLVFGLIEMLQDDVSYLRITHPYQRFKASRWALHFSILQHRHLTRLLFKKGLWPKRGVFFLQTATIQNILESDGGTWRFRHRILQDYFAKHWDEVYGEADKDHKSRKNRS